MSVEALNDTKERPLVKAAEIAKRYSITPAVVYRWAKLGKIPSVTFQGTVRFDLAAVCETIEGKRTAAAH